MVLSPNLEDEMIMVTVSDDHDAAWVNPDGTSGMSGIHVPAMAEPPPDNLPDPLILIDKSGVYGSEEFPLPGWSPGPGQQEELDRIGRLEAIIWEAADDFARNHTPPDMPPPNMPT